MGFLHSLFPSLEVFLFQKRHPEWIVAGLRLFHSSDVKGDLRTLKGGPSGGMRR